MNIAVTGATGFIGNNLSRALASEHNVLALTRSPQKQLNTPNLIVLSKFLEENILHT